VDEIRNKLENSILQIYSRHPQFSESAEWER